MLMKQSMAVLEPYWKQFCILFLVKGIVLSSTDASAYQYYLSADMMMLPMDHTGKILPIYSSISTMIVLTICSSKPLLHYCSALNVQKPKLQLCL